MLAATRPRGLLALAAAAAAVATARAASFSVDTAGTAAPLRFPMLESVGSGHAALALRADYREQLKNLVRDVGFTHIRGHGVLDDDMSAYLNGAANMFNVYSIYDYYLSIGVRPIVELSFMPEALANNTAQTIMHYKGITSPPKNYTAWGAFITEFVQLLVDRYGIEEVRQFAFEVWNEPNGCGFWCGGQAGYFELYRATAEAIKGVDPLLQVGGPATAQLLWVADMLNFTSSNNVPIDFLSTHLYPSDPGLPQQRTVFEAGVSGAASLAAAAGIPLVLTEYSYGWSLQVVDDPYPASFAAHLALAFQNTSDAGIANTHTLSWWCFSDIFEEPGMYPAPYYVPGAPAAKMGLQTNQGVPKPSYRAFQMISSLRGLNGLPVTVTGAGAGGGDDADAESASWYGPSRELSVGATSGTVDVLAAVDTSMAPATTVRLLVTNFNAKVSSGTLPVSPEPVTIAFANVPASRVAGASATLTLIDSTHAYAKPVWLASGSPTYPNASEIAAELAASQMVPQPLALTPSGANGLLADLGTLEPYATAMLVLTY